MTTITVEEYRAMKGKRRHKYGAKKAAVDGLVFDSKGEARRYRELKLLEEAGHISDLKLQPHFELQPAFTDSAGKRHRAIHYVGDFAYVEDGREIIEDTKGVATSVFKLKYKLLLFRYPDIEFRINWL